MPQERGLRIFRFDDAPLLEDTDVQPLTSELTPQEAELWGRNIEAGYSHGQEARVLVRSFGPLGAALGLLGLGWSFRRDWRTATVLVAIFVPQAVLGASYLLESNYQLPRHWVFYLPGFLIWLREPVPQGDPDAGDAREPAAQDARPLGLVGER